MIVSACAPTDDVQESVRLTWDRDPVASELPTGGEGRLGRQEVPELPRNTRLIGLEVDDLQELFGRPSLARLEQPAQYWRYNFRGCIIDIYLYKDGRNALHRVQHVELRSAFDGIQNDPCRDLRGMMQRDGQGVEDPELTSH